PKELSTENAGKSPGFQRFPHGFPLFLGKIQKTTQKSRFWIEVFVRKPAFLWKAAGPRPLPCGKRPIPAHLKEVAFYDQEAKARALPDSGGAGPAGGDRAGAAAPARFSALLSALPGGGLGRAAQSSER